MGYKEDLLEVLNAERDERKKRYEAQIEQWLKNEGDEEIIALSKKNPLINCDRKREEVMQDLLQFLESSSGVSTMATATALMKTHASNVMTLKEQEEMYRELYKSKDHIDRVIKEDSFELKENTSTQKLLNIPQQYLDAFQKVGNLLYESRDFEGAKTVYTFLLILNHLVVNYWMGLGHSYFQMQEYETASQVYYQGAIRSQEDPLPYLHLTNSCLKQGDTSYAITTITYIETLLKKNPNPEVQKLLENLKEKSRRNA